MGNLDMTNTGNFQYLATYSITGHIISLMELPMFCRKGIDADALPNTLNYLGKNDYKEYRSRFQPLAITFSKVHSIIFTGYDLMFWGHVFNRCQIL